MSDNGKRERWLKSVAHNPDMYAFDVATEWCEQDQTEVISFDDLREVLRRAFVDGMTWGPRSAEELSIDPNDLGDLGKCNRCSKFVEVEDGYCCDGVFYCDGCDPLDCESIPETGRQGG